MQAGVGVQPKGVCCICVCGCIQDTSQAAVAAVMRLLFNMPHLLPCMGVHAWLALMHPLQSVFGLCAQCGVRFP